MAHGRVAREVGVKLALKPLQHVGVGVVAGDELPLVEPHAVVEQQLYVAADQLAAVAVHGPLDFHAYLAEAVAEDGLLLL